MGGLGGAEPPQEKELTIMNPWYSKAEHAAVDNEEQSVPFVDVLKEKAGGRRPVGESKFKHCDHGPREGAPLSKY